MIIFIAIAIAVYFLLSKNGQLFNIGTQSVNTGIQTDLTFNQQIPSPILQSMSYTDAMVQASKGINPFPMLTASNNYGLPVGDTPTVGTNAYVSLMAENFQATNNPPQVALPPPTISAPAVAQQAAAGLSSGGYTEIIYQTPNGPTRFYSNNQKELQAVMAQIQSQGLTVLATGPLGQTGY